MIKTGTTTVNDHYFFPESIIKAVNKSGIRAELTRVLMNSDGNLDERYNELETLITNYTNKYETISINVGIHGLYTANQECIEKAIKLAKSNSLNIHMHYLEITKNTKILWLIIILKNLMKLSINISKKLLVFLHIVSNCKIKILKYLKT